MGLRIHTNVTAIRALRSVRITDRVQARSLERLSTGLRIVRASDDPSGLVISEQLRAQISSLNQAVENSQAASNLISTTDAALAELSDLLIGIRDSVTFAMNTGPASPEQVSAEQDAVDHALASIDRIANTTRFADRPLLNGASAIPVIAASATLNDLQIRSVSFAPGVGSASFEARVSVQGSQARIRLITPDLNNGASSITLRVTGPRGTADVEATNSGGSLVLEDVIERAVNQVAGFTGVYASSTFPAVQEVNLLSEEFGSAQVISLEVLDGSMDLGGPGFRVTDEGQDFEVQLNGTTYVGRGREFDIVSPFLEVEFTLDRSETVGSVRSFRVRESGMFFQLNAQPLPTDGIRVGIDSMNAAALGFEREDDEVAVAGGAAAGTTMGGYLTELRTGALSDLANDPSNAARVVDAALDRLNGVRGYLGALQAQTIEPNIDSLGVAIENLQASESVIRDLDFAEETSSFSRNQILFQAGTAVLASANLIPQTVLTLLR